MAKDKLRHNGTQRMARRQVAVRHQKHRLRRLDVVHKKHQEIERRPVSPMRVLDHQDQRAGAGELLKQNEDRLEEAGACPLVGHGGGAKLGKKAGKLRRRRGQ